MNKKIKQRVIDGIISSSVVIAKQTSGRVILRRSGEYWSLSNNGEHLPPMNDSEAYGFIRGWGLAVKATFNAVENWEGIPNQPGSKLISRTITTTLPVT